MVCNVRRTCCASVRIARQSLEQRHATLVLLGTISQGKMKTSTLAQPASKDHSVGRLLLLTFSTLLKVRVSFWLYLSIYHLFLPPNLPKLESAFLNMLIYPHSCAGAVHLKGPQTAQAKASTSGFSSPSAVCYGGEFVFNQPNSAPPTNELLVGCSYRPFNGTVFKGMKEKDFPPFFKKVLFFS